MRSVFEIAARYVEPSLKRILVEKLLEMGISASEVAACLRVSPSLVTRYSRRERGVQDLSAIPEVDTALQKLASRVVEEGLCGEDLYLEVARLVVFVMSRKYACAIHYHLSEDVNPATCNICPTLFATPPSR